MSDQAAELRQLVRRANRLRAVAGDPSPRFVVAAGGKGGVGATTVAVNLAAALAREGRRVVLVDADLHSPDAGTICGLDPRRTIADVLAGRATVHESLLCGPSGVQVLPGAWDFADRAPGAAEPIEARPDRLFAELRQLGPFAEWVVVDVGAGRHELARRFWRAADWLLIVATPDPVAILDAYSAIKSNLAGEARAPLHSVVNQAPDVDVAREVHARLARACRRFLALKMTAAGAIPRDATAATGATLRRRLLVDSDDDQVVAACSALAAAVVAGAAPGGSELETNHGAEAIAASA